MVGRRVPGGALFAAALFVMLLVPAPAAAQIQSCGEGFELFIRNPDIVPDNQGVFHVSGSLLVQFQVIGDRADEIEAFGLSFGLDIPTREEVCALPSLAWLTGAYLEAYALDSDKSDGFFIAINSNGQTSPQTQLGVAVHGYDAAGTEVARFWGIVDLDHCDSQPSLGCPDTEFPDFTMPWMILLPGDGEVRPVTGFVFEFNEELSALRVELNGIDVTSQLTDWTDRPDWDQDSFPDGGPGGIWQDALSPCSLPSPLHECGPLVGPAYQWTERALDDDDVVRIIATDMAGNTAVKEIHIGSPVAGGTIADGLPVLQMTFEESRVTVAPGETAVFRMRMQNNGGGEGHPFARAAVPSGWNYTWVPGHQPVPAGGTSAQELHIAVPALANVGEFPVRPIIDYRQGSVDKTLESQLFVDVQLAPGQTLAPEAVDDEESSPGAGPLAVVAMLVGMAVVAARRRS
jgi:hypothetical protein